MRMFRAVLMCAALAAPLATLAQHASTPAPAPEPPEGQQPARRRSGSVMVGPVDADIRMHVETEAMRMKSPLGKWWKDSETVQELGVTPQQVAQLEKIFMDHRLKLIDLRADLERQETQLEPLIEADQPDETRVGAQIDAIAAARGRLEKAHTLMTLAIRKTLSVDQWKKLQEMPRTRVIKFGPGGPRELYFKERREPGVRPAPAPPPRPMIEELEL